jgi:hypothetical protein
MHMDTLVVMRSVRTKQSGTGTVQLRRGENTRTGGAEKNEDLVRSWDHLNGFWNTEEEDAQLGINQPPKSSAWGLTSQPISP